ncbi:50S ribosomal protein L34e [archaeon CG10_big_fil_rev_8_21_14_0_10_43_11]|nr:MAG: 50S ribosomal protein L34e [archaeon CG10_big_fil_rev_8_21_14_0_10_43_11]
MRRAQRSRSLKRVKKRVPSGESRLSFKKELPGKIVCAECGSELHGIAREKPIRFSNLNKSARTVSRKYGGMLCSSCSRESIRKEARVMFA